MRALTEHGCACQAGLRAGQAELAALTGFAGHRAQTAKQRASGVEHSRCCLPDSRCEQQGDGTGWVRSEFANDAFMERRSVLRVGFGAALLWNLNAE